MSSKLNQSNQHREGQGLVFHHRPQQGSRTSAGDALDSPVARVCPFILRGHPAKAQQQHTG